MNTTKINVNGQEFLRVEIIAVNQKNSRFYIGILPAVDLTKVFTVKPTKYNSEAEAAIAATFSDDEEYLEHRISTKRKRAESDEFERPQNKTRINKIASWLEDNEYPLFPNTIIVTCYLINDEITIPPGAPIDKVLEILTGKELQFSYLQEDLDDPDKAYLYIPNKDGAILVIDGQHRLKGLQFAPEEVRQNYDVLVSFMLGFPRAVVAEFFYTINYEQKPVNKSILYELMGEFSYELNEITFMHEMVRVLNVVDKSPFYRRIKMLGVVEKEATFEIKEKMTISQAFLIDYLVNTISKDAMRSPTYPPIFLYYYQDKEKHTQLIRFVLNYFKAIRRKMEAAWENPESSIICNSIGIGALIRVMHFIFIKIFVAEFEQDPDKIQELDIEKITEKLAGLEDVDFSKSKWSGMSSGGTLNNLVKDIVTKLNYLEATDYDEFIRKYRSDYLALFKQWLSSVTK